MLVYIDWFLAYYRFVKAALKHLAQYEIVYTHSHRVGIWWINGKKDRNWIDAEKDREKKKNDIDRNLKKKNKKK